MNLAMLKQFFPESVPRPAGGAVAPAAAVAAVPRPNPAHAGFKLIIELGGLCVFLPAADGRSMFVFMPKPLKRPGILEHQAVVQFLLSDVQGLQGAPLGVEGVWKLSGRHLEISSPGLDAQVQPSLEIAGFDYANPDPDTRLRVPPIEDFLDTMPHFGWVSSLRSACEARGTIGGGNLDRNFLNEPLDPARAAILDARMALTAGNIEVSDFLSTEQGYLLYAYRPFGASPGPNDHQQFVAAEVRYELDVPDASVVLRAKSLSDPNLVETLTLAPSSLNRVLQIRIVNEEADAILGTAASVANDPLVPKEADRIFETFTQLCPGAQVLVQSSAVPIPIPLGVRAAKRGPGPLHRSVPCSPEVAS